MSEAGPFSPKFDNRDPVSKVPFFKAGFRGQLQIDKCIHMTTRKGDAAFIAEFTVLSTSNPNEFPVGAKRSWYQSLKEETGHDAVILFLYAALGLDKARDGEKIAKDVAPKQSALLNAAVGPRNILATKKVALETAEITTKAGKPFTKHIFTPAAA